MNTTMNAHQIAHQIAQVSSQLPSALPRLDWITDAQRLQRLSQDFSWFSPVLKQALQGKYGDVAVRPRTEGEIASVVAHCARQGLPITVRGSGTGNYGQSTPLHGGVILDLSAYNQLCWVHGAVGRAQTGMRLWDLDRQARAQGQELRWLPSTYRSATLGGLFGGGFGGAGSITYGPLAAPGNVLAARVMTVEAEPRVLELRGLDAMRLHHTYGTTGIVLELEVALAPATPWLECIATFEGFDAALAFAQQLGQAPGIAKKELALMAAPIPAYFTGLAAYLPEGCHAVIALVAPEAEETMQCWLAQHGGTLRYCVRDQWAADKPVGGHKSLIECCWNHTTLHALKVDKGLTYLQTGYQPARFAEQLHALRSALGDEVLFHLEFLRNRDGLFSCSGVELVRFTSEQRLNAIMDIYRQHGVLVHNPHVYVMEDGKGNNQLDPGLLQAKAMLDPLNLLNPGKLRKAGLPACVQQT
jgi:FAD/FMN-containing dehydrogenase